MADFSGKVFAVTGASSGIGKRIAETAGELGAHVFMCGRSEDALQVSREKIEAAGGAATVQTFDITDQKALRNFIHSAANHRQGLDVMVNNAGLGYIEESIVDGEPEHWREMLDVNVHALLVGCQQAAKEMRASGIAGRIINISSNAANRRNSGVYGATKHAVNVISASLRHELRDDDIRVTVIMPGPYATNFSRNLSPETIERMSKLIGVEVDFTQGDKLPEELQKKLQQALSKEIGNPQVIADAVVYIVRQPIDVGIDEVLIRPPKIEE